MKYLTIASIIISIIALSVATYLYFELRQLKCDVVDGVFAEREYTYPILRDIGYNPDDYGKGKMNPITTSGRYAVDCK